MLPILSAPLATPDSDRRHAPRPVRDPAVFGATWLAVIAFAIVGNYPTPLVGYGSSAIVGYCLSAAVLADPDQSASLACGSDRESYALTTNRDVEHRLM